MIFFVTGGSRGIGRSIVLEAVRAGHDVGFSFLSGEDRAEQVTAQVMDEARTIRPDARCQAFPLNVDDSSAVETVGEAFIDAFGGVDVVVPNGGINQSNPVLSMTDAEWDRVIRTNLTGVFYVCRYFLPMMLANRFGRFIMISSLAYNGISGQANYCAAKAGLHGLSAALAKECGRKGITSNVVVPGFLETDISLHTASKEIRELWEKFNPLGRVGEIQNVADAVLFLSSKDASFINGTVLPVTGGLDWLP